LALIQQAPLADLKAFLLRRESKKTEVSSHSEMVDAAVKIFLTNMMKMSRLRGKIYHYSLHKNQKVNLFFRHFE